MFHLKAKVATVAASSQRLAFSAVVIGTRFASTSSNAEKKYKVVVVGGGTAGASVAARIAKDAQFWAHRDILIIDPAETHYYQPLWTLVGGGLKTIEASAKKMKDVIPDHCEWLQDKVTTIDPEHNKLHVGSGKAVSYDYLVVAPGIQINWDKIPGLKESLGKHGVTSNYSAESVQLTREFIENTKGGVAIFTQPSTPIKCAGAPQKIMYLAEEIWRKNGAREKTKVVFNQAMGKIFAVDKYAAALNKICKDRNITVNLSTELVEIVQPASQKKAVFKKPDGTLETVSYDFMHVTPPMGPPAFLKESGKDLANEAGWVNVDKETCQHVKYPNIFSLGDASSLPTSKTAAAAAAQTKIVADNLLNVMKKSVPAAKYNGYTSCPLVVSDSEVIMAEFSGYSMQPMETFPVDQGVPRKTMGFIKMHALPFVYWNMMLKGNWAGPQIVKNFLNPLASK
ncbi:mitochondrial sulfide:quinone oxidoreductase [Cladochytrium replicatum]|nr:mitochondrial sulfide:quinone oxidoreductase [Cladochytrium replicatum]